MRNEWIIVSIMPPIRVPRQSEIHDYYMADALRSLERMRENGERAREARSPRPFSYLHVASSMGLSRIDDQSV